MAAFLALIVGLILGAGGYYVALKQHLLPPSAIPVTAEAPPPAPAAAPPPLGTVWRGANALAQLTADANAAPGHSITVTVTPDSTAPGCPDSGGDFQPAPGEQVLKTAWGSYSYFSVKNQSGHQLVFHTPAECDPTTN